MSEIALYNVLTKLGVEHKEAEAAVAGIAKKEEVATKSDIAKLKEELTWRLVIGLGVVVAILKFLPGWSQ